jgi:hypothetical protein
MKLRLGGKGLVTLRTLSFWRTRLAAPENFLTPANLSPRKSRPAAPQRRPLYTHISITISSLSLTSFLPVSPLAGLASRHLRAGQSD